MYHNLDDARSLCIARLNIAIGETIDRNDPIFKKYPVPKYLNGGMAIRTYPNFGENINIVNDFVLAQDRPFQCEFVRVLYLLIGHHDHMEVEAILARPRIRAEALYLTLINKGNK